MRALDELTTFVDKLEATESFEEAADWLTSWARKLTGCESGLLRMLQPDGSLAWLPACTEQGHSEAFLRDEAIVANAECICGMVTMGQYDSSPCFTPKGSFVWGRLQSLGNELGPNIANSLRGRCTREGYDSLAVFPVLSGERRVGSLHLADPQREIFDESIQIVESAASLAGRVLLRHQRREREQSAFSLIQQALLPLKPPKTPGLELGISFRSATELAQIGGDFYEVMDLGERGVLLLVGDFSGKGIEAAGLAAQVRYTMTTLARSDPGPARLLDAANEALMSVLPEGRFVTCAACLIVPGDQHMRLAVAGHPAPLRISGGAVEELQVPAHLPLGVSPAPGYREATQSLGIGETLILYTDGITDARQGGQLFGIEGIAEVCRDSCARDPEGLATAICRQSSSFHDQESAPDDRLVLVVALGGSPT